ncbi:MAG TPA: hypothetical protein PLW77_02405 [Bacteroidales bacterium]|nr:hypothetical protein [Bacteroidales bacterium]HQB21876.1 hypothetical protein [Bacteroidales bacterium]
MTKDKEENVSKQEETEKQKIQEAKVVKNSSPEIESILMQMQEFSGAMHVQDPVLSKINEKHIDKLLDIAQKEEDNSYKDAQSTKRYSLVYFILIVIFISFLIFYLADKDKSLLLAIIEKGLYILGGFGGGYGFKAYLDNKKKK